MRTVRDLMMKNVITVPAATPVVEAVKTMQEKKIGALIVSEGEKPVGIFTERDLVGKFFVIIENPNINEIKLGDIMTKHLITVSPDQAYSDSLKYMEVKGIRHLPVVEEDRVVGILSVRDLLNQVISDYQHHVDLK